MPLGTFDKCTYLECDILESFCGATCYSGPKTCCKGVLYTNKKGYVCCGSNYILGEGRDVVCCGSQFHTRLNNHECCGNRYVEVLPGQICCADPNEDRVDVGEGDSCCGSFPFSSNGSQICCDSVLYDSYGAQCCGARVISDSLTCCGNASVGKAYHTHSDKYCCGVTYVPVVTSVCCTDPVGNVKTLVSKIDQKRDRGGKDLWREAEKERDRGGTDLWREAERERDRGGTDLWREAERERDRGGTDLWREAERKR
ncbi:hypothetical protein LSAT2_000768 [Lamellibrachia satsuma]|nr:hypothetical protein LSAT2_000768 [Lamellibrachia satsuma]